MYACVWMGYSAAAETKPPNPGAPTSSGPPNAMQGYDAPSPGSVLSSCRMLLFFVCQTEWLAGWLTEWLSERVRVCSCAVSKSPAPLFYPQHTASSTSQHQHPTPPTRPRPASWLSGILATANGVPMDSPCRAACWLDNRMLSNEDDGNDFTPSLPSPSAGAWNFFRIHRPSNIRWTVIITLIIFFIKSHTPKVMRHFIKMTALRLPILYFAYSWSGQLKIEGSISHFSASNLETEGFKPFAQSTISTNNLQMNIEPTI